MPAVDPRISSFECHCSLQFEITMHSFLVRERKVCGSEEMKRLSGCLISTCPSAEARRRPPRCEGLDSLCVFLDQDFVLLTEDSLKTANQSKDLPKKYMSVGRRRIVARRRRRRSVAEDAFSPPRRVAAAVMAMMLASMTLSLVNTDARNECKQA